MISQGLVSKEIHRTVYLEKPVCTGSLAQPSGKAGGKNEGPEWAGDSRRIHTKRAGRAKPGVSAS